MRIVSLNAWGGAVWPTLAEWVPKIGADILCLQEVTRRLSPSGDWVIYRDPYRELDQRADLFADISALLPRHAGRFAAAARGDLTESSGSLVRSEHGIAQWVHRDLAVSEHLQRFVVGQFRPDGWGPEPVPRAFQISRIEAGTSSLLVAHLHGLRDPSGKGDTPTRLEQAHAVATALQTLRRPGDALVLMGDLNILPDSQTFDILRQVGLTELVTTRGITDTRTSLYSKPVRHANYCFVSAAVDVAHFEAPAQPEMSDHRPLVLDCNV